MFVYASLGPPSSRTLLRDPGPALGRGALDYQWNYDSGTGHAKDSIPFLEGATSCAPALPPLLRTSSRLLTRSR